MKGYAFLDVDFRLQYRSKEYIEVDNPFFWQQNKYDILNKWKFDTDDLDSMFFMFRQIRDVFRGSKLSQETVKDFCKIIGFDMKVLKDAYKIQPEQD
jgi:hypothetical protein